MAYVTFNVSPFETDFEPPVKLLEENSTPPVAEVLAMVVMPDPPETIMLPVTVAVPIIENDVVVADFDPLADALHATSNRLAIMLEVTSVMPGVA